MSTDMVVAISPLPDMMSRPCELNWTTSSPPITGTSWYTCWKRTNERPSLVSLVFAATSWLAWSVTPKSWPYADRKPRAASSALAPGLKEAGCGMGLDSSVPMKSTFPVSVSVDTVTPPFVTNCSC